MPTANQFFFSRSTFAYRCHRYISKPKSQAQVFRPKHMMKVRHIVETLCLQFRIKGIQPPQSFMFTRQISTDKTHISRKSLKKRLPHSTTQHSNFKLRILHCQRMYYRYRHGYIAKSWKTDNENTRHSLFFCIKHRIQCRVIIHLHLFVYFHIFLPWFDIRQ